MSETIQPDILHLEACNFIDQPIGGQLNFSRQLLQAMGNRLALVGWTSSSSEPVGCWFNKKINGIIYRYFAIGRDRSSDSKPLLPARLITWIQLQKYQSRIFSIDIPNIIVSEHSILMGMKMKKGYNICYCFPGVASPLSISKYKWAKIFSTVFDRLFFRTLARKASCILAAADDPSIAELKRKAGDALIGKTIISFPTRVDTDIFHPGNRLIAREKLGLPSDKIIVTASGRIHWAKGWLFLLDSFLLFNKRFPNSRLVFLGDGAERKVLKQKIISLGLEEKVLITGHKPSDIVSTYLQSSDMLIMGSLKEGWSTVLLEALACHIPIVTTCFSSADTIVKQGVNGFVVERDAEVFAKNMEKVLKLQNVSEYSSKAIRHYALNNLEIDLLNVWSFR